MANIKKAFNFRNGLQIDDDNVVVNENGLVGIGTSIPSAALDVIGNTKISGIASINQLFTNLINVKGNTVLESGSIGLATFSSSGIVSATVGVLTYYGDGGKLLNLPTSQWLDVDIGIGFTSVYAQGNVGVATNSPVFSFQVGGNNSFAGFDGGLGINSTGSVVTTGIITAASFSGSGSGLSQLNASNLATGTVPDAAIPTIPNSKIPSSISVSGIITANQFSGQFIGTVTGDVVGIASTAISLTSDASIQINSIVAGFATCGLTTVAQLDVRNTTTNRGTIGINTTTHRSDLHITKASGISSILLVSSESLITLGRNLGSGNGGLRFGTSAATYVDPLKKYSTRDTLEVSNYSDGNTNFYLTSNSSKFHWIWGTDVDNPKMTMTSGGLIVGSGTTIRLSNETLRVAGILTVTDGNDAFFDNNVYVKGTLVAGDVTINLDGRNLNTSSGISTFYDINILDKLSINSASPFSSLRSADLVVGDWSASRTGCVILNGELDPTVGFATGIGVGIGTTALRVVSVGGISTTHRLDAFQAAGVFRAVGVGTTVLNAFVDFSGAGSNTQSNAYRFMIVPKVSNTTGLTAVTGGLLYDVSTNSFKGYTGSAWTEFATGSTASAITVATDSSTNPLYVTLSGGTSGSQSIKVNTSLSYNPGGGGTLTAGTFSGSFSGSGANVTSLSASNISSGTLAVNRGGTNSTASPTNGGVAYGTGTAYAFTSAGLSGQVLQSNGAAAPTWVPNAPTFTPGSVQSGAQTVAASDFGTTVRYSPTTGGGGNNNKITIPSGLSVTGKQLLIYVENGAAGAPARLIPGSGVTIYYSGFSGAVAEVQAPENSVITVLCLASDTYVAYGNGLTAV